MTLLVIYDGNCNLCVTLIQLLELLDQGKQFKYLPMQQLQGLEQLGITSTDCKLGMMLVDPENSTQRWQGSAAAEEIGRILPGGSLFVAAYRALPGLKWTGDRLYEQVRDHRYEWFGQRSDTYQSVYPNCSPCSPSQTSAQTDPKSSS
ncbi:MAG: thiol-disulfide oxidoreductase DCC family protein [Microcoleaceae cyanobacterium]